MAIDLHHVCKRLHATLLLDRHYASLPHVGRVVTNIAGYDVMGVVGHQDDNTHPDRWTLWFCADLGPLPDNLGDVHISGNAETMRRDLAVLLANDFAHAPETSASVATIDLSHVRRRLHEIYNLEQNGAGLGYGTPFTHARFTHVEHVRACEFGDIIGLAAHHGHDQDQGHPERWSIGFRTDGVPWFLTQDWRVEGNVDAMERDVAKLLLTDLIFDPYPFGRPKRRLGGVGTSSTDQSGDGP